MAFVKYEADVAPRPDVKINGTTIVVSVSAWDEAGLRGAESMSLWWDEKRKLIGISSTSDDDRNKFTAKINSRGISIPAKKLFDKFHLGVLKPTGGLYEVDNVVAFKVAPPAPSVAPTASGTMPKRRGRPPRNQSA